MIRKLMAVLVSLVCMSVFAYGSAEEKLLDASNALKSMLRDSNAIPSSVSSKAQAIGVFPGTLEISMLLGGKTGNGVMVVRKDDGSWSYPFFVSLGGAGFGLQLGVEKKDILMIFQTKDSVKKMMDNKMTLGVDASVAAGPAGASIGKGAEVNFQAEVFTYTKTEGLFLGFSLDGSVLNHDYDQNIELYGNNIMPDQIVESDSLLSSYGVEEFLKAIAQMNP
jgi:SH3 domain-containing YSC84-like protein 1